MSLRLQKLTYDKFPHWAAGSHAEAWLFRRRGLYCPGNSVTLGEVQALGGRALQFPWAHGGRRNKRRSLACPRGGCSSACLQAHRSPLSCSCRSPLSPTLQCCGRGKPWGNVAQGVVCHQALGSLGAEVRALLVLHFLLSSAASSSSQEAVRKRFLHARTISFELRWGGSRR